MDTAAALGRKLRKGKIDPVELAEQTLEAIKACDDQAIFIDVLAERALGEARLTAFPSVGKICLILRAM
jgi:Asp-tRNA(Asn)/Glu-tRNA(Gln) amidotransferase A subunit family amidase